MPEKSSLTSSYFHAIEKQSMPKWVFVALIASSFIIIMWVVGLVVLASHSKSARKVSVLAPSPTIVQSEALAPTPLTIQPSPPPNGWKLFSTSIYTISYPPDWTAKTFAANLVEIYNPKQATDPLNNSLVGSSLSAQFVLIRVTQSSLTPVQYVNTVQLACCTGPSPTPRVTNLFQKQAVTLKSVVGEAYTIPATNFLNWSVVFSAKGNLIELSSSITSLVGTKTENTIVNTLSLMH
jgi:hypothetical protein